MSTNAGVEDSEPVLAGVAWRVDARSSIGTSVTMHATWRSAVLAAAAAFRESHTIGVSLFKRTGPSEWTLVGSDDSA